MNDFQVSLIIATYNRGPAIAPTLDSVLTQTLPVSEVLVVDDGSTDQTAEWIRSHYPAVRVVSKINGGTSSARNFGAQRACGNILIFLDHDDLLLPHAVETLCRLLREFPEAEAAYCDHEYINNQSGIRYANHHRQQAAFHRLANVRSYETIGPARLYKRELYSALLKGNLLQQPWAVRRRTFEEVGGFSEHIRYCEDWDIYLRMTARYPIVLSDEVISQHIVEGENLHLTASDKQIEMYDLVLRAQARELGIFDLRDRATIRQKLAIQDKAKGDDAMAKGNARLAWSYYFRSAKLWPADPVVLFRVVSWSPSIIRHNKNVGSKPSQVDR